MKPEPIQSGTDNDEASPRRVVSSHNRRPEKMNALAELLESGRSEGQLLVFENVVVGLDGAAPDCASADFIKKKMVAVRFERSQFSWKMTGSEFERVDFIGCDFDRVLMMKSRWRHCSFERSTLIPDFSDAIFEDCNFAGARLRGLGQGYGGRRTRFIRCDFTACQLDRLQILAGRFEDCRLDGLQIVKCDLRGTLTNGQLLQKNADPFGTDNDGAAPRRV